MCWSAASRLRNLKYCAVDNFALSFWQDGFASMRHNMQYKQPTDKTAQHEWNKIENYFQFDDPKDVARFNDISNKEAWQHTFP